MRNCGDSCVPEPLIKAELRKHRRKSHSLVYPRPLFAEPVQQQEQQPSNSYVEHKGPNEAKESE